MLKQTKFEDKTVKSTQLSLVLIGLHDFQIFPDRTAHAWSVEVGNICSVSVFFVRVGSQISQLRAKKDQISPLVGEQDQSNALPQGQQRQSNPPRRHNIDRCITNMQGNLENVSKCRHQVTPMLINWAPIFYNSIECWTRYYQYPMKQNWQRVSILYWAS